MDGAASAPSVASTSVAAPSGSSQGQARLASSPASAPNTRVNTRSTVYTPSLVITANSAATAAGLRA